VRLYLREIAETPLLTHAQEIELAKRVEDGDMAATQLFVRANLRLVVSIAKRYVNRGLDPAGPDPGREYRVDACGPEIRLAQGFPF